MNMFEPIFTLFCLKKMVSKPVHHELRPSESPLSNRAECWVRVVEVCAVTRDATSLCRYARVQQQRQFCADAKVTAAE